MRDTNLSHEEPSLKRCNLAIKCSLGITVHNDSAMSLYHRPKEEKHLPDSAHGRLGSVRRCKSEQDRQPTRVSVSQALLYPSSISQPPPQQPVSRPSSLGACPPPSLFPPFPRG